MIMSEKKSCNDCKYYSLTGCNLEGIDKLDCRSHGFSNYAEDSEPTLGMVQKTALTNSWNGAKETDFPNDRLVFKGKHYRAVQGACSAASCALWGNCHQGKIQCKLDYGERWEELPELNRLRPNYYVVNSIECKDVIGEFSYNIGAAMKYLWRHGRKTEEGMSEKEKAIEDLKKSVQHIEFEIKRLKSKSQKNE